MCICTHLVVTIKTYTYNYIERKRFVCVCMGIYHWRGKMNEEEKERWFLWSDMTNKGEDLHMLNRERGRRRNKKTTWIKISRFNDGVIISLNKTKVKQINQKDYSMIFLMHWFHRLNKMIVYSTKYIISYIIEKDNLFIPETTHFRRLSVSWH
jgi:hypothetical protein